MAGLRGTISRVDPGLRYSEAVVHGDVVYLAGQVPGEEALDGDAGVQTASVLAQVDALLARVGSDKSRLLSATIYLASFDSYTRMNEVWDAWLPSGAAPARATVGNVVLARREWLLEIVIVAALRPASSSALW